MLVKLCNMALRSRPVRKLANRRLARQMDADFADKDANPLLRMVREYASGKSFVDVGCLWGVHGMYAFEAEAAGAIDVKAVDIYPASPEFEENRKRRESRVQFIQGDMNESATRETVGAVDIVYNSGVLYHVPNPVHFLHQLRLVCRERLIFATATVPEFSGFKNGAVFYPYLSEAERSKWVTNTGRQRGVTGPYEPENGYGNWFWGYSPSCVTSMLHCAGFEVEKQYATPFMGYFVCKTAPIEFSPVSGDWSRPGDEEVARYRKD